MYEFVQVLNFLPFIEKKKLMQRIQGTFIFPLDIGAVWEGSKHISTY